MKRKHWILAITACVLCLGIGFGAGALLMPRASLGQPLPANPMAMNAGGQTLLGAGAPADTQLMGAAPALGATGRPTNTLAKYIDAMGGNPTQDQKDFFYMALSGMENELRQCAERVQKPMNLEKELRVLIAELKELAPSGDEKAEFPKELFDECTAIQEAIVAMFQTNRYDVALSLSVKAGEMLGSAEWQGVIGELESWRDTVRDYGELAKYDLQEMYQDYTQAVKTLAGIQKQMYDDAMKILNNFKQ